MSYFDKNHHFYMYNIYILYVNYTYILFIFYVYCSIIDLGENDLIYKEMKWHQKII